MSEIDTQRLDEAFLDVVQFEESPTFEPPPGRSILDLLRMQVPEADTLLGRRFLCRGGALLFVGPSGIGKSSASMQQDILWALGREAFGIRPRRPLRILTAQAENDDGDLHEMAAGVVRGLELPGETLAELGDNVMYLNNRTETGDAFVEWLRIEALSFKPDIIRIDPLMAFLGADVKDTEKLSAFCRGALNRLVDECACGLILNHHTPKTNHRAATETWRASDWQYGGAGAADLTNWARAVMVIDPCDTEGLYRWIAAKRGSRIGWVDPDGKPSTQMFFRHADRGICWVPADADTVAKARKPTKLDLLNLIPEAEPIRKTTLEQKAKDYGIGRDNARGWLSTLMDEGLVRHVDIPHPNAGGKGSRSIAGVQRALVDGPAN